MKRRSLLNSGTSISIRDLLEEIRNLKRLLNLVKVHVMYDRELYNEIKEAIKE
jgi:hypothetical protein